MQPDFAEDEEEGEDEDEALRSWVFFGCKSPDRLSIADRTLILFFSMSGEGGNSTLGKDK